MSRHREDDSDVVEEEGEEYYFPPELDEFLEYCVDQHGHDWEAISGDFMDIAKELEEHLVQRAADAFSPEALRERYLRLYADPEFVQEELDLEECSEERTETESVATTPQAPSQAGQASGDSNLTSTTMSSASAGKAALQGALDIQGTEKPSGFSVLKDSLKDQIDKIYSEVQNNLPTTLDDDEDDDDDDDEDDEDLEAEGCTGDALAAGADGAGYAEGLLADGLVDGELDDLTSAPNFNSVLLSMGINPTDVTGPALPAAIAASLKRVKGDERQGDAQEAPLAEADRADGVPKRAAAPAPHVRPPCSPEGEEGGGESEDEDVRSDDSLDDDFLAMRQTVKQSSLQMIDSTPSSSSTAPPRPTYTKPQSQPPFAPKPRRPVAPNAPRTAQTFQRRLPQQKFVKLELVASSEEEDEDEADSAGDAESDLGDLNAKLPDEEEEHLHVMRRLLSRAPEGNGQWDVWLEATRAWPRLQLKLGTPNFYQSNGDMRVAFDVDKLRSLLQEEEQALQERRQLRTEQEEQLSSKTEEFVREAERRRELLGQRLGSFVLTSQRAELQVA